MEHFVHHLNLVSGRHEFVSAAAAAIFGRSHQELCDDGVAAVVQHRMPGDFD
jgi:hypothetical protein